MVSRAQAYVPLANRVAVIWERLRPYWSGTFKEAGLDLREGSPADLIERLLEPTDFKIEEKAFERQEGLEGLAEFSRDGCRGIEPGDPARSLFYHVLASPHITPKHVDDEFYPTMAELEIIENCIYSAALPGLDELQARAPGERLAIVVFAYEYAIAKDTVHRCHADLCFSRTGISRVGNERPHYVPKARGFFPASGDKNKVHVVPARFGAFVAAKYAGNEKTIGPMRFTAEDEKRKFWIPLHKLFNGPECIRGLDIDLQFTASHKNEKIRKVHLALQSEGTPTGWDAGQMQLPPFVITKDLANFRPVEGLMVPVPHRPLVEPAKFEKGTKKERYVGFPVPPNHTLLNATLWLESTLDARMSPEFVHVKHKIKRSRGKEKIVYLPTLDRRDIQDVVKKGNYEAANFIDWTADGWIEVHCEALTTSIGHRLAAYSVLAQPDFFPQVKQQDLADWWENRAPAEVRKLIWPDQGITPIPLSDARLPANITLLDAAFDSTETTMTAIVGVDRKPGPPGRILDHRPKRESTLSYRATNVFAPGWDASKDFGRDAKSTQGTYHLANYGLGSPFPEDSLICAASGAFWPAAVPDITRFFVPDTYPSVTPILDRQANWAKVSKPKNYRTKTTFNSFAYADYVESISKSTFDYEEFSNVTLDDYIQRTLVTARIFQYLKVIDPLARSRYFFLSFKEATRGEFNLLQTNGWNNGQRSTYRILIALLATIGKPRSGRPQKTQVISEKPRLLFAGPSAIAEADPADPGTWIVSEF